MAWYLLPPQTAVDINGNPVTSAVVRAFTDQSGTTAVPMRDPVSHDTLTTLVITNHVTPRVEVDITPAAGGCYLKSGAAPACWVESPAAMVAYAASTGGGSSLPATTSVAGVIKLATAEATAAGVDDTTAVTPAGLAAAIADVGSGVATAIATANAAAPLAGSVRFSKNPGVRPGGDSNSFMVIFQTPTQPTVMIADLDEWHRTP